ncbi:MAG TPA: sigma-70 family RNA polymerase sigma factor [Myxococcota bacterium]|nr:sigma-70 family RNA polymerase sigma factor [Myxococcota bacterium]
MATRDSLDEGARTGAASLRSLASTGPPSPLDHAGLVRHYGEDVLRLCRRMLGHAHDAEDARSETFLRAQQAAASWDGRPVRAWLLGIASHHCVDRLRRRALEGRLFEARDLAEDDLPAQAASPLTLLLARERSGQLEAALAELPDKYRAPLVLRFLADQSYAEIAAALGVSDAQVAVLVFRAKARLRDALAADPRRKRSARGAGAERRASP